VQSPTGNACGNTKTSNKPYPRHQPPAIRSDVSVAAIYGYQYNELRNGAKELGVCSLGML